MRLPDNLEHLLRACLHHHFIGWLVGIVGLIAGFVIMIICIVKALKREYYEIPIFGKIRIIPEV